MAAEIGLTVARVSQLIAREEAKAMIDDGEPVAPVTRRRAKEEK